jgi:hypothetical protein
VDTHWYCLSDAFRNEKLTLPASGRENTTHEWLTSINGVCYLIKNGVKEYFLEGTTQKLTSSALKRKNLSPLIASGEQTPKKPFLPSVFQFTSKPMTPQPTTSRQTPKVAKRRQLPPPAARKSQRPSDFMGSKITSTAIKKNRHPRVFEHVEDLPKKRVRNYEEFYENLLTI